MSDAAERAILRAIKRRVAAVDGRGIAQAQRLLYLDLCAVGGATPAIDAETAAAARSVATAIRDTYAQRRVG